MSKIGLKIEDLPTLEELDEINKKKLMILAKKYPNAHLVLQDKMALTQSFLFQNSNLMEMQDQNLLTSISRRFAQNSFFGFVTPIIVNIGLGPITRGHFFDLPKFARVFIRLGVFALPLTYFSMVNYNTYIRASGYFINKYLDRVELFMKTNDPKFMNPNFDQEQG